MERTLFEWQTFNNVDCAVEVKVYVDENNHLRLWLRGGCWHDDEYDLDLTELMENSRREEE